jgi:hypothetical protein
LLRDVFDVLVRRKVSKQIVRQDDKRKKWVYKKFKQVLDLKENESKTSNSDSDKDKDKAIEK